MRLKAIDGVSISQLQNKFMTGDELIPVEYDGKTYNINTRDIFNNVSDYNVSVLFPNDGINGDNKYDLEQACKILKPYFDNQNAKHGFIISFYNSDNIIEKWLFCKDNIAPKNFMKINTYENPNNYIGVLKKGVYPNKYVIFKGKQFAGLSISINFNTNKIPLDTDYLTLMFGLNETNLVTNDKIGNKNSVDDITWWGAWNKILEYYITNMPYCKIGIIIADAWFHKTLRDELIKISNYWGIPYLDLKGDLQVPMMLDGRYDNSIINSKAIQLRNKAFQTSDTDHHPNPKGHLYRSTIIENFLRRL